MGVPDANAISIAENAILLVDDEPLIRRLARVFLELEGFRVLEASDAAEALELYHANAARIQLVLTDLNMPGMTGIELATQIRRQRPEMPIVFISGSLSQFGAYQMTGCVSVDKPFQAGELAGCVRKALATAREGELSAIMRRSGFA